MFLSTSILILALLSGSAVTQFHFIGKHETAKCPAVNRATDKMTTIEIRERQSGMRPDVVPGLTPLLYDRLRRYKPRSKRHSYIRPWVAGCLVHLEAPDKRVQGSSQDLKGS